MFLLTVGTFELLEVANVAFLLDKLLKKSILKIGVNIFLTINQSIN